MRTLSLIALVLLAGVADAKDKPGSLLTVADLDPRLVLPPPPTKKSIQSAAELAELHAMQRQRSDVDLASARHDDELKSAAIFTEALGPAFDLDQLPATKHLFDLVRATEKDVADRGKAEFKRERPWIVDPSIVSCSRSDEPLSSYPSGHTSMGYAMAGILVRLIPAKADTILARAARYGQNRIVCEQHFRSDVTAGEALGLLIAERLMDKPAFVTAFDTAQKELEAAGLR